jgi:hypothetical protein
MGDGTNPNVKTKKDLHKLHKYNIKNKDDSYLNNMTRNYFEE